MFKWLRRRRAGPLAPELPEITAPEESPPPWAAALVEAVQKSMRAQARLTLQVEDLDRKLEGGMAELRDVLSSLKEVAEAAAEPRWDDLLDALDLMDEAVRVSGPVLGPGLERVASRFARFLEQSGLTRLAPVGHPPDGRLFRVVGTQANPRLPEGVIAQVVRAAVLQGERVVREGEAITVRNPT